MEVEKGGGPRLHYHKTFSEKFEAIEGNLNLQVGKEKIVLEPGESFVIAPGVNHRFYNESYRTVKFNIEIRPGHTGMENFLKIIYGLASGGLSNKKGEPKKYCK